LGNDGSVAVDEPFGDHRVDAVPAGSRKSSATAPVGISQGSLKRDAVAIVTGGTQGIGLATAAALAERGARVVAVSRNSERWAAATASLAPAVAERIIGLPADVRDQASVEKVVETVVQRFGKLDIVVNSAGVSMTAKRRFADTSADEWLRIVETNLNGTYFMSRAALPHLEDGGGYLINVQSTGAFVASAGASLYAASKFGVRALTEALIEEYRGSNVRVSSVSPGPVDTTIWTHKDSPPSADERSKMIPPADIADIIVWLLDRPGALHVKDITVTPWIAS
jgi:NAD(P)-dependent dehydrogenase (short-subunit alcohol dehydrogenase family)